MQPPPWQNAICRPWGLVEAKPDPEPPLLIPEPAPAQGLLEPRVAKLAKPLADRAGDSNPVLLTTVGLRAANEPAAQGVQAVAAAAPAYVPAPHGWQNTGELVVAYAYPEGPYGFEAYEAQLLALNAANPPV